MVSPEPSPDSKKNGFVLLDAELNMINGSSNGPDRSNGSNKLDVKIPITRRNVITPINECFTPDSCDSPYVNKPANISR